MSGTNDNWAKNLDISKSINQCHKSSVFKNGWLCVKEAMWSACKNAEALVGDLCDDNMHDEFVADWKIYNVKNLETLHLLNYHYRLLMKIMDSFYLVSPCRITFLPCKKLGSLCTCTII